MKTGRTRSALVVSLLIVLGRAGAARGSERSLNLSVDQAVSMALAENLGLQLQKCEVDGARGAVLLEKGVFDSRLEAGIVAQDQRMTSLITGEEEKEKGVLWDAAIRKKLVTGTEIGLVWENSRLEADSTLLVIDPSYRSGLAVTVSQQLMRGSGKAVQTAGIRAAEKITAAASHLVDKQAVDLAAQVKKTYWELVFARQDIEVKELSLKLARKLWEETNSKIKNEVLARVEIYQPESEIARREERLIAAEKHLAATEDDLKLLMNNRDWRVSFVPVDVFEIPSRAPDLQTVLANALARRPDILATDLQVDAAGIMVARAHDDLRPSLALVGAAGISGVGDDYSASLDTAFSDPTASWQIGLKLQLPIGNSSSRGLLAQATAQLTRSRLRAELLRQDAEKTARVAVRDVLLASKTIEATRKTSLAAEKMLEAEQEKFRVGLATANDVLESQDSYAQALAGEKRALVDLATAQAELERIQGVVGFENTARRDPTHRESAALVCRKQ